MNETRHFVNEGFGWECKRCRARGGGAAARADEETTTASLPRFFREGEAEAGAQRLSTHALARWADESRTALRCPGCGAEEDLGG